MKSLDVSPLLIESNPEIEKLSKLLVSLRDKNFYEVLEIERSSTEDQVEAAFRKKVSAYHPDNKPTELRDIYNQIFQLYSEAKSTLTNVGERSRYDAEVSPELPYKSSEETKKRTSREILNLFLMCDPVMAYLNFLADKKKAKEKGIMNPEEVNQIVQPYVAQNTIGMLERYGYRFLVEQKNKWKKEGMILDYSKDQLVYIKKLVINEIIESIKLFTNTHGGKSESYDNFLFYIVGFTYNEIIKTEEIAELWEKYKDWNQSERKRLNELFEVGKKDTEV